ncbi:MAG: HAD family hydrolase [Abitibacteriaceae bacterium]|nr:HAD family hydrolase [Abditibacteriaceae bacterium]MBV9863800.1 HAD family hydrolase [Abditibacteriaceae bacterium]
MNSLQNIKGLLIDIDDTITRHKAGVPMSGSSLFDVLQTAGVALGCLSAHETARRIESVKNEVRWWHWSDFIVALELNPKQFWDYAYNIESTYLEATGAEILPALCRLQAHGMLLYIASNNPSSGILHKLRLAGIAHVNGSTLFSQLLGATEMHAMKWEPNYWRKALAHIALDASEVAVVGDNPHDDYAVPREVGIPVSFILDRFCDRRGQSTESLIYVNDFDEIADALLPEKHLHPLVNGKVSDPALQAKLVLNGATVPC